jgi:DNA-binding transcriptional ArsR family regulator
LDPAQIAAFANLMVGYRLDSTFHALADPTRRALLARLAEGEKSVAELTRGLAMSGTGAAKHLAVLAAAGLVRRRRDGRHSLCALDVDALTEAALWLRRWQRFEGPRAARLRVTLDAAEAAP